MLNISYDDFLLPFQSNDMLKSYTPVGFIESTLLEVPFSEAFCKLELQQLMCSVYFS